MNPCELNTNAVPTEWNQPTVATFHLRWNSLDVWLTEKPNTSVAFPEIPIPRTSCFQRGWGQSCVTTGIQTGIYLKCVHFWQQVKLDLPESTEDQYDDCNALVLPSKKRTTKLSFEPKPVKKLSKKQRRKLEKILEMKEKKKNVCFPSLITYFFQEKFSVCKKYTPVRKMYVLWCLSVFSRGPGCWNHFRRCRLLKKRLLFLLPHLTCIRENWKGIYFQATLLDEEPLCHPLS